MIGPLTRRQWLQHTGLAAAATMLPLSRVARGADGSPVESVATVSMQPHLFHGWPTVARRADGELLLVCSGGRDGHVCPFGRVELMRSRDGGKTWTWPQTVIDTAVDDRDAGVLETSQGTLLVTTFTSLAYEEYTPTAEQIDRGLRGWTRERLGRWQSARDRLDAEARKKALGCWVVRSTDAGNSWSAPIDSIVNSPHGPMVHSNGHLIYVGKQLWNDGKIGACVSTDDGQQWKWIGEIPVRRGDQLEHYHELHAVEASDGRIVAQIRNHNQANEGETLQTESTDNGVTWSEPRLTGVWGYPSHLTRLVDGRLLMTYGHRRPPFGSQARTSDDNGETWSEPIVLSGDDVSRDLGYPSTVQLDDGTLVSAWYEQPIDAADREAIDATHGSAVLRVARWKLPD